MPKYELEFSYKAKLQYDIYIHEDCSLIREDYLMENIKSIIDKNAWSLECNYSEREWIGIVIGCINDSWNIEEYELTDESTGEEINIAEKIRFNTPRKTIYDSDISDRLARELEIYFENDGFDIDESFIYDECKHLNTSFELLTFIDVTTVEAKAILKEMD